MLTFKMHTATHWTGSKMTLATLALLLISISASAQDRVPACQMGDRVMSGTWYSSWSDVAATGTIDPNDIGKVLFGGDIGTVTLKPGMTEAVLRYNVALETGVHDANYNVAAYNAFRVRYLKPTSDSRVVVKLKSYNVKTGVTTTLAIFDSNECDNPVSANFQARAKSFKRTDDPHTWADLTYYLEARLSRTTAAGNPGLGMIMIGRLAF